MLSTIISTAYTKWNILSPKDEKITVIEGFIQEVVFDIDFEKWIEFGQKIKLKASDYKEGE